MKRFVGSFTQVIQQLPIYTLLYSVLCNQVQRSLLHYKHCPQCGMMLLECENAFHSTDALLLMGFNAEHMLLCHQQQHTRQNIYSVPAQLMSLDLALDS